MKLLEDELFDEDFVAEEQRIPWQIEDLEGADWVFRKIKQVQDSYKDKEDYAKRQIEKYQQFLKQEKEKAESEEMFWQGKLSVYLDQEKEKDPKFKLKTAVGMANYRKSKKWKYEDEKVLAFLKANDFESYVRVKEEINKAELKKVLQVTEDGKAVTEDGEIVEGIAIEETQSLSVKLY